MVIPSTVTGMDAPWRWLLLVVFTTSTLSGVFGMAGGLILLAVLAAALATDAALVLHGGIQLLANGSRCLLLLSHVRWRGVAAYALGAAPAILVVWALAPRLGGPALLIALGVLPWVGSCLHPHPALRMDLPRTAVVCGALVTATQLVVGVSGPLLDLFFVRSRWSRLEIVATKACTQTIGHAAKVVVIGARLPEGPPAPTAFLVLAGVAAVAGTAAGRAVLKRWSDRGFRRWSTVLVRATATVLIVRGLVAR